MKQFSIIVALLIIQAAAYAQPRLGSKAPNISLPGADGTVITLSSLKGKIVLLDFWASWCGPCRRNNRKILPLYNQYKDKGFEVYSVSIDDNKEAWAKAIQQDKMTWLHVIDMRAATGNELTATWNLQYIPSAFLLDKSGKIIAISPNEDELEKRLKKLL